MVDRLGNRGAVQQLLQGARARPAQSRPEDPIERNARAVATRLTTEAIEPRPPRLAEAKPPQPLPVPAKSAGGGGGYPLDAASRAFFEPRLGYDLAGVRVHDDAGAHRAAGAAGARAFTIGSDIIFGAGRYAPSSRGGQELLAHELVHVVDPRAVGPRLWRDADPDDPDVVDPANPPPEPDGLVPDNSTFHYRVLGEDPTVFAVPGNVTRTDIARRLFGDETLDSVFDFVVVPHLWSHDGVSERAIRPRDVTQLSDEAARVMYAALDTKRDSDLARVLSILKQRSIDDADEWEMVRITMVWSQAWAIPSPGGESYFDSFLGGLFRVNLVQPHWYTLTLTEDTRNALSWLLIETEDKSSQIAAAMALRSKKYQQTGFTLGSPTKGPLPINTEAGVMYSDQNDGFPFYIEFNLLRETSLERAERALRNMSGDKPRAVIPSADGAFYGYTLSSRSVVGPFSEGVAGPMTGHFVFYQPGALYIPARASEADFPKGGLDALAQRSAILKHSLDSADLTGGQSLLSLDLDVLAVATSEQKLGMFERFIGRGKPGEAASAFLARVLMSVPANQFAAFERALSMAGVMKNLIDWGVDSPALQRVFTLKALASLPIGAESFTGMEGFPVGEDGDGVHYAFAESVDVDSSTVAATNWDVTKSPTIGSEPALPGETAGPVKRSAITFTIGRRPPGTFSNVETVRKTRPMLPTELMKIDLVGDLPQTVYVTALEAVSIGYSGVSTALMVTGKKLVNTLLWANAGMGLAKAFTPALAEALAAGSLKTGLSELITIGASQAGKKALWSFGKEAALLYSLQKLDEHRAELSKTEEGRAFLAVADVALTVWVAHDVFRVLNSGLIGKLADAGWAALKVVGSAGRNVVARATEIAEALRLAFSRMPKSEMTEAISDDGLQMMMPTEKGKATFGQLFSIARAEVAGRAVSKVFAEAGVSSSRADAVLKKLRDLGAGDATMAKAATDIAHRAANMTTAEIEAFLAAVEETLAVPGRNAAELGGFMRAAAGATSPLAYLADVRALLARRGVGNQAIKVVSAKAARGTIDLPWLLSTSLTDEQINYMGADALTKWNFIRDAAVSGDPKRLGQALSNLRGIAAEMEGEAAAEVLPGMKIAERQAKMVDSIIDFLLTDRSGIRYGYEVKGWTNETWRDALNAWLRKGATDLTAEELEGISMMERTKKQLADIRTATGRPGLLGVTDGLNAPTRGKLDAFLKSEAPGVEIVGIDEAKIKAQAASLRKAVGQ